MTEMDLPSLHLPRDCAMSITEGGGGKMTLGRG